VVIREIIKRLRTTEGGAISNAGRNCSKLLQDIKGSIEYYLQTGKILEETTSPSPSSHKDALMPFPGAPGIDEGPK
jgi:hypothetical protein